MNERYYITTSIPYVNAAPHIGHALELIQADALARYHRLAGADVTYQTGTDENAFKNVIAAGRLGVPVRHLVDLNSQRFRDLADRLGIAYDSFIRTTESRHELSVHQFWTHLSPADLEIRGYRGLYCHGCEDFVTERDLVGGRCPDHGVAPSEVEERNYFFALSRYQDRLERLVDSDELLVRPEARKREVLSFIRAGLHDISVSRDAGRVENWGIAVPGDPSQIIYVWIDALINYVSGIGYGTDSGWMKLWGGATRVLHVIGKNVWKFHAVYWPALLLSAGLPLPAEILVHGFLTAEGKKISKSLGNVVDPFSESEVLGPDSLRLFLLSLSTAADGDYSRGALSSFHNREIAERIGSTVTRVTALCERIGPTVRVPPELPQVPASFHEQMRSFRFDRALDVLFGILDSVNAEIARERPWEAEAGGAAVVGRLQQWIASLSVVACWLGAFAPGISRRMREVLTEAPIRKPPTLFPRVSG